MLLKNNPFSFKQLIFFISLTKSNPTFLFLPRLNLQKKIIKTPNLNTTRPLGVTPVLLKKQAKVFSLRKQKPLSPYREDAFFYSFFTRWLQHFLGSHLFFFFDRNSMYRLQLQDLYLLFNFERRLAYLVSYGDTTALGMWSNCAPAVFLSVLSRDPELLISWVKTRLPRMNLFAHRRFFRLLGIVIKSLTYSYNNSMLSGLDFYLVGKISVTGNAMSRSQLVRVGLCGKSNLRIQSHSAFTLVYTNTGCLGLTLTYSYNF